MAQAIIFARYFNLDVYSQSFLSLCCESVFLCFALTLHQTSLIVSDSGIFCLFVGFCGVSRVIFQGSNALALDAKGRMNIPQKHRDALIELSGGALTLTKHPEGCLQLLPRNVWEKMREAIAALPMGGGNAKRFFLGSASDVEIDSAGRILISPELRDFAQLTRDVMLLGVGSSFEVWDTRKFAEMEQKSIEAGMPEVLNGLCF